MCYLGLHVHSKFIDRAGNNKYQTQQSKGDFLRACGVVRHMSLVALVATCGILHYPLYTLYVWNIS